MHDFRPVPALLGGALIGIAASLFLLTHGRVAGISGLYGGILRRRGSDWSVRVAFVLGLVSAGLGARWLYPQAFAGTWSPSLGVALIAGLLVGLGTQIGSGCTSGHGVCGISRMSVRSVVATGVFMTTAAATVFVTRHLLGGSP